MPIPVGRQLAGAEGEYVTGQVGDVHPGQEQETALADEVLEVSPPGLIIPADPAVARLHAPGGAAVLENTEDFRGGSAGLNQVTQMSAEGSGAAQVVVAFEEVTGLLAPLRVIGQHQPDRLNAPSGRVSGRGEGVSPC